MFPAACANPVVVDLNHSYLRCPEARGGGDGGGHFALTLSRVVMQFSCTSPLRLSLHRKGRYQPLQGGATHI